MRNKPYRGAEGPARTFGPAAAGHRRGRGPAPRGRPRRAAGAEARAARGAPRRPAPRPHQRGVARRTSWSGRARPWAGPTRGCSASTYHRIRAAEPPVGDYAFRSDPMLQRSEYKNRTSPKTLGGCACGHRLTDPVSTRRRPWSGGGGGCCCGRCCRGRSRRGCAAPPLTRPSGWSGASAARPWRTVRALLGRFSALSVFLWKSILYGASVRARRALTGPKRRFPARAVAAMRQRFHEAGGPQRSLLCDLGVGPPGHVGQAPNPRSGSRGLADTGAALEVPAVDGPR